jgi:hypothetical protein
MAVVRARVVRDRDARGGGRFGAAGIVLVARPGHGGGDIGDRARGSPDS